MTRLAAAYREYNKLYFSNKLPHDIDVKWKKNMPPIGLWIAGTILINAAYKKEHMIWRLTLLHEMAHVATAAEKAEHGPRWKREMRRLARIGAFDKLW